MKQSVNSDKLIRVLFATATTTGGGAERMLFNIIRQMDSQHECRLFITSSQKVPLLFSDDILAINANKTHAISAFPQLLREIRSFQPQHIFTTSSNVGYLLVLAKKILHADFKIYIRCAVPPSEIYQKDIKTRLLNRIIRKTYSEATLIIAQTDFSRADLIRAYNLKSEKVKTIRNIVDIQLIKTQADDGDAPELKDGAFNIVAAGALYSVKGFDLLVESVAKLLKGTNRHLYILGEERYELGYRARLQKQINELGVSDNIHLLGHKSNPYPYYRKSNLFVLSSRKEAFPNVVLEALTLGTPVVATDVVDWTGVITPGVNGFVALKNDVESLETQIHQALEKPIMISAQTFNNFNYNELFR